MDYTLESYLDDMQEYEPELTGEEPHDTKELSLFGVELNLAGISFCPNCGGEGKFDDHVETDLGEMQLYQCQNEDCGTWFYVK